MKTGKKVLIGMLLVTLSLSAVAGISFAAENANPSGPTATFANACRGFFGGAVDALAKLLGLNPEQIIEKRNAGQSLADIAKDQGVAEDKVVSTIVEAREKVLEERVKAGVITEEQKNLMLEQMKSRIGERIKDPAVGNGRGGCGNCAGPGYGRGGGFGPGARGGGYGSAPSAPTNNI